MASNSRWLFFLLLPVGSLLDAQSLAVGLQGGWRDPVQFEGTAGGQSRQYAVGPMVTAGLPLGIGWAARIAHGSQDFSGSFLTHGLVVGGGIQIPLGRLRLAPEVRYTRWNQPVLSGTFPDGPSYRSGQNQIDVLLGISWQVRGRS